MSQMNQDSEIVEMNGIMLTLYPATASYLHSMSSVTDISQKTE
jgi:hypothetical protein